MNAFKASDLIEHLLKTDVNRYKSRSLSLLTQLSSGAVLNLISLTSHQRAASDDNTNVTPC